MATRSIEAFRTPKEETIPEISAKIFADAQKLLEKHGQITHNGQIENPLKAGLREMAGGLSVKPAAFEMGLRIPSLQVDWRGTHFARENAPNPLNPNIKLPPVFDRIEFIGFPVSQNGRQTDKQLTLGYDQEHNQIIPRFEGLDAQNQRSALLALEKQVHTVGQHFRDKDRIAKLRRVATTVRRFIIGERAVDK